MRLTADRLHVDVSADPRLADLVADNLFRAQKFDGTESETLQIGTGFGTTTDIEQGPDGNLYVVSVTDNAIYKTSRRSWKRNKGEGTQSAQDAHVRTIVLSCASCASCGPLLGRNALMEYRRLGPLKVSLVGVGCKHLRLADGCSGNGCGRVRAENFHAGESGAHGSPDRIH